MESEQTPQQDPHEIPVVWDEADQLAKFQQRLSALKIDRRVALQIFAVAGGAAALAACGSSSNNNNKSTAAPSASAPAGAASATAAKPAGGSPAAGASPSAAGNAKPSQAPAPPPAGTKLAADQTFRWNTEVDFVTHDYNGQGPYCLGEIELWAGLLQFNPDLEPVPDMAESFTVSPDGAVYTFKIRKDTTWTNGQPVKAQDFDYSFRRVLNPDTHNPYASFLYDIKNGEAYNTKKIPDGSTLGLKVVDDNTLQVTLEGPAAYFPALQAYIAAFPGYKDAIDKFGDKWTEPGNIVSNGPYKLTKSEHNKGWEMVKHDGYWNAKNINITHVVRPIIDATAAEAAFENNELDWVQSVGPSDFKRVTGDDKLKKLTVPFSLDGTWYLVPEVDKPPFDTLQVRQAMAHAVDRDTIVKNVLQGQGVAAYTFVPPGTPGFNPNKYDDMTKYDPQKAKDLLKGTPYEGGKNWPKITMTQRTQGEGEKAAGDAIVQMLKDNLGMDITHEVGDPKDVYARMYQRKLQLIWIRWYEDYPDPNDEQNLVFLSTAGGADGHRQAWHNDDYDKLVRQAAGEPDVKKRLDLYQQADAILAKDAGAIFVYYPQYTGLLKSTIGGMPKDRQGVAVPTFNIFVRMFDYLYVTA